LNNQGFNHNQKSHIDDLNHNQCSKAYPGTKSQTNNQNKTFIPIVIDQLMAFPVLITRHDPDQRGRDLLQHDDPNSTKPVLNL